MGANKLGGDEFIRIINSKRYWKEGDYKLMRIR